MILTFFLAASSSRFAKADNWEAQAKQIEALEKQGQLSSALATVAQLIGDLKRLDSSNQFLPGAIDRKASIEEELGQFREAERDYMEAIGLRRSGPNATPLGLATELNNFASLCTSTGKFGKAEALRRESLALRLRVLGSDDGEVALSYSNLSVDLFQERRYAESASLCERALAIWAKTDPAHNRSDLALNTLALIELRNGRFSQALSYALAALAQYRADGNGIADTSRMAGYKHTVALARRAMGQLDRSEVDFRSALLLLDELLQNSPSIERIGLLTDYAQLLKQMGRTKDAKRLLHRAALETNTLGQINQWQHTVDVKALLPKVVGEK